LRIIKRFPFTICMGIVVLLIGLMSATAWDRIDSTTIKLFGLSPNHVYAFNLYGLITSAFLTHGGIIFWRAWTMLCACLFWCEYTAGTRKALAAFWLGHAATILLVSWVVVPIVLLARPQAGDLIVVASDVGPSAGYIACLALAVVSIRSARDRMLVWSVIASVLVGLILMRTHLLQTKPAFWLADVSHLVSFLITSGSLFAWDFLRSTKANPKR
tara:strand:- start:95751 stop:96395 length:645 start_codon:yes stop_codon:yes gene_type:complete